MADPKVKILFEADAGAAIASVKDLTNALNGMSKGAQATSAATIASGVALGLMMKDLATKAFDMATDIISSFVDSGNAVYKMQMIMGGSAEEMSAMKFTAESVGVSFDALARASLMMERNIATNGKAARALGIDLKDSSGHARSATDIFKEAVSKIQAIPDASSKAGAAQMLFGKGVSTIMPLLNLTNGQMDAFKKKAKDLGVVLSSDDVNGARNYQARMNELKGAFEGLGNMVARNLLPAITRLITWFADGIKWVKDFFANWDSHSTLVKALAGAIIGVAVALGIMAVALGVAAVATQIQAVVTGELAAALMATGIPEVIIAILALVTALVVGIKTWEPFGDIVIWVAGVIGNTLGKALGVGISALSSFAKIFASAIDLILLGVKGLAEISDFFNITDNMVGTIDRAREAVAGFAGTITSTLDGAAQAAWDGGQKVGESVGKGIVSAIKALEIPTFDDLFAGGGTVPTGETPDLTSGGGGGGGGGSKKNTIDDRKKAILAFFTELVNSQREALNAARQAAVKAKADMKQMGDDLAKSMADAFNITDMTESSFAKYLGVGALMQKMRKKMHDMHEFTNDVKKLASMGLPHEMLMQIVNAGVDGGLDTARMLIANPGSFKELSKIQDQINRDTQSMGRTLAKIALGPEVERTSNEAAKAQLTFGDYLSAAKKIGYVPTAEDKAALRANVRNEITINTRVTASPKEIADAVAWALKTGMDLGMGPSAMAGK